jgi:hypothetical protein
MNCVVNAIKGSLPRFYIFMGERIKKTSTSNIESKNMHEDAKGSTDYYFLFKKI